AAGGAPRRRRLSRSAPSDAAEARRLGTQGYGGVVARRRRHRRCVGGDDADSCRHRSRPSARRTVAPLVLERGADADRRGRGARGGRPRGCGRARAGAALYRGAGGAHSDGRFFPAITILSALAERSTRVSSRLADRIQLMNSRRPAGVSALNFAAASLSALSAALSGAGTSGSVPLSSSSDIVIVSPALAFAAFCMALL